MLGIKKGFKMREILFRGKDRSGWLYGSLTQGRHSHIWVAENVIYQVFPDSVGQYTGLKDKSGNKIFEGDLLKNSSGQVSQVIFNTPAGCWFCKNVDGNEEGRGFITEYFYKFEIIGNIFDNPEFLNAA